MMMPRSTCLTKASTPATLKIESISEKMMTPPWVPHMPAAPAGQTVPPMTTTAMDSRS